MTTAHTPRQDRVLSLKKDGLSLEEIALRDGSSPEAIKHLLQRMRRKAGYRLERNLRRLTKKYPAKIIAEETR